jgi:glycosyltransferase involved in cell wall biosynthesis
LWDEAKNVAALCRVADSLPWPAYVAGSTHSPDGADQNIERVHALGVLPARELAEWLARASIYAFPARYEPFGLSVLEAALSSCTLVLGDIDSLREIWGDAAAYVDPSDDDQLARTLHWMCDDASLRRALAARARTRALELTPARMAEEYLAAYERLRHARISGEVAACAS